MTRWFATLVLAALGLAVAGEFASSALKAQPPPRRRAAPAQPPAEETRQGRSDRTDQAEDRGPDPLRLAYDTITLVSVWMSAPQAKLPEDWARFVDQAKEYYRNAHATYQKGDYRRAAELALAANEAARGVLQVLRANAAGVTGLPAPPEPATAPPAGERAREGAAPPRGGREGSERAAADPVAEMLRYVRQGLDQAARDGTGRESGQAFVDAGRKVYEQARQAYQGGDRSKAVELAMGADAWSHVSYHLNRASGRARAGTESDRRYGEAPPGDRREELRTPRPRSRNQAPPSRPPDR
jgi:hypothetical protein